MASPALLELARARPILFDGAIGTELMARGLPAGACPELWTVERPEVVRDIHGRYFEAGADAVSTNSFGANPIKLAAHGLESRCRELNRTAAEIAVRARPPRGFVLGSVGPTGKFLKPQGEYSESDFEAAFGTQVAALADGGIDAFLVETMFDLREALCAVRAALRLGRVPVFATITFNRTRRGFFTLMGDSPEKCAGAFDRLGLEAYGTNCTLAGSDMAGVLEEFRRHSAKLLIGQPNAGQPEVRSSGEIVYSQGVEDFSAGVERMIEAGANFVGGCCGTNPEYIRRVSALLKSRPS
jgi:5-methyltetrahydrofolate--homocysteine methyltransferase